MNCIQRIYPAVFAALLLMMAAASPVLAVEGRIPIYNQITIDQPGSYIVTRDFSVETGSAITITVDRVHLDLDGHSITNNGSSDTITNGTSGAVDIGIRNGKIIGGNYQINLTATTIGGQFLVDGITAVPGATTTAKGIHLEGGKHSRLPSARHRAAMHCDRLR